MMGDEFMDFPPIQPDDPGSLCQAWEACAGQYQYHRNLAEEEAAAAYTRPEGDSRGFADDATWILTSSFVIFTMQSGFGLLEAGSCSPGFEVNIMMKNIIDVVFSSLTYWLVGYGISFGEPSTPFMGRGDMPALGGVDVVESGLLYSQYIFQLSFAATSTTIVSGCVAMRLKFHVYMLYSLISVIFYAFVAHWIFVDNGFLKARGVHDFAGGAPVHVFGGINGLIATMFLGPRLGRFDGSRPLADFFPSSASSQCFGLLALWWGWIGFNCGSSFGITNDKWVVAIRCAVTTINATVGGGIAALLYTFWRTGGKLIIPEHVINGILGSLVAITPACAGTSTWASFIIGGVGALVGLGINTFVCRCRIDDPVGAVGVHAGSGIWGLLSVGLFGDSRLPGTDVKDGLFFGGGFELLGLQALAILCTVAWALVWSTCFFYFVGVGLSGDWKRPRAGLRVPVEEEERGADWFLHGVPDHEACRKDTEGSSDEGTFGQGEGFCENHAERDPTRRSDMYKRSICQPDDLESNGDDHGEVVEKLQNINGDYDDERGTDPSNEETQRPPADETVPTQRSAWPARNGQWGKNEIGDTIDVDENDPSTEDKMVKTLSRRPPTAARNNTGVLGKSSISHYAARDSRVTREGLEKLQRSSASRNLEIYR